MLNASSPVELNRYVSPLRAVRAEWPSLRASKPATSVIFARDGKIAVLDLATAESVAALFGLRPTLAERMRASKNPGLWVIAIDDAGRAEAFVIANDDASEILSVRGGHRV